MKIQFYKNNILNEELITTKAIEWAKNFIRPKRSVDKRNNNPPLTSAQLRKFHLEAKTLEERIKNLKNPEEDFLKIRPLIKMLKSKAAYSCPNSGRDRKIPVEFREFIEQMVDSIEDVKDFRVFALCFEAVVGYFYGEGGR
jgi:CRISPR type III-A-associated protein Csm2